MQAVAEAVALRPSSVDFVDELYASAVEPQRLTGALALFADVMNADFACLLVKDFAASGDRTRVLARSGGSDARSDAAATDHLAALVNAEILPGQERVIVGAPAAAGPIRAGRVASNGAAKALAYVAVTVKGGPWVSLCVIAGRGRISFSEDERGRADALLSDIRRALQLRQLASATAPFSLRLRDEDPIAVVVLRDRCIEHANAAARQLLSTAKVIAEVEGELKFCDRRAQATLEAAMRTQAKGGSSRRATSLVMRPPGMGAWIAQFAEVESGPSPRLSLRPPAPATCVVLTPFETASRSRAAMLEGFANLTPTERQILSAFVDGLCIADIAAATQRSVETVRWHVRNLFRKVGVSSQADLARVGALLLPI